jgi:hypothetical protein
METVQQHVDAILRRKQRPVITLFPGTEVLMSKGRRGRPRSRSLDRPFEHYADDRACLRPVRCLAKGCQRRLKARQRGACSEACADAVFNQALLMLRMIGATREELAEHYWGSKKSSVPTAPSSPPHDVRASRPSERRLRKARKAASRLISGQ